jgi:hypothetical protein
LIDDSACLEHCTIKTNFVTQVLICSVVQHKKGGIRKKHMLNTFLVKMPHFWKESAREKAVTYAFPMNTINESESHYIFVYDFQEETTN